MERHIEQVTTSLTVEIQDDPPLTIYRLKDTQPATVDTYIDYDLKRLESWDKRKVFFVIHDVSHPDVTMSPYLRSKLNKVMEYIKHNHIHVRSALLLSRGFAGSVLETFGNLLNMRAKYMVQRYFTDEADAHAWIEAEMTAAGLKRTS